MFTSEGLATGEIFSIIALKSDDTETAVRRGSAEMKWSLDVRGDADLGFRISELSSLEHAGCVNIVG